MTGRTSTLAPLVVGISLMAGGLSLLSYELFSPRQRAAGAAHENGAAATTASPLEAAQVGSEEADRVAALSFQYRDASPAERKALLPEVVQTLRSYRKEWQGNKQRQLLFEASYLDLADRVKDDLAKPADRNVANDAAEKSALRMKYLTDTSELLRGVERARRLLSLKDYTGCRDKCEAVISGWHSPLPSVELALGVSYVRTGDSRQALEAFLDVIEYCHQLYPEEAAAASYLAGRQLVRDARYEEAVRMFEALKRDYPRAHYSLLAGEYCLLLRKARGQPVGEDELNGLPDHFVASLADLEKRGMQPPPERPRPSARIESLLAAIPPPGKHEQMTTEAQAQLEKTLEEAHRFDEMVPYCGNRLPDRKKAAEWYLASIQANPASGNDPAIMLRLTQLYLALAIRPGAEPAPSILPDAMILAQKTVGLFSTDSLNGIRARFACMETFRIGHENKQLLEEYERTLREMGQPGAFHLMSGGERQAAELMRVRLSALFVTECRSSVDQFYPQPLQMLVRTSQAISDPRAVKECASGVVMILDDLTGQDKIDGQGAPDPEDSCSMTFMENGAVARERARGPL